MHSLSSSFVLGYHGCSREIGEAILRGDEQLRVSVNEYDWLGSGIYFWETNPIRGLQWANEAVKRKKFDEPFVVGAVIDLGYCFDLMSHNAMQALKAAYHSFRRACTKSPKFHDADFPENKGSRDLLQRHLDCAVINYFHENREKTGLTSFDSVRGVFVEGDPVYPAAGFCDKTHIQIAVRNSSLIKGVFRVPQEHLE
jgi:hypothetical protein